MPVKLQIFQASVISLLTALNTIVIALFLGSSTLCSFRGKDSFLGLQQAMLRGLRQGINWYLWMRFYAMVGSAFLVGRSSLSCVLLCPVWLAFDNRCFCALLTVFSRSYLKTFPLFFLLAWSAW